MTGWIILGTLYATIAGLVATFSWALAGVKLDPKRDRGYHDDEWNKDAFHQLYWTIGAIVWPLYIAAAILWALVTFTAPAVKKLVDFWTYLIKEVDSPRENV